MDRRRGGLTRTLTHTCDLSRVRRTRYYCAMSPASITIMGKNHIFIYRLNILLDFKGECDATAKSFKCVLALAPRQPILSQAAVAADSLCARRARARPSPPLPLPPRASHTTRPDSPSRNVPATARARALTASRMAEISLSTSSINAMTKSTSLALTSASACACVMRKDRS